MLITKILSWIIYPQPPSSTRPSFTNATWDPARLGLIPVLPLCLSWPTIIKSLPHKSSCPSPFHGRRYPVGFGSTGKNGMEDSSSPLMAFWYDKLRDLTFLRFIGNSSELSTLVHDDRTSFARFKALVLSDEYRVGTLRARSTSISYGIASLIMPRSSKAMPERCLFDSSSIGK